MILILSQRTIEPTTCRVMDWLRRLGADCFRLNLQDLEDNDGLCMELSNQDRRLHLTLDGQTVDLDAVRVVWFRRQGELMLQGLKGISRKNPLYGQMRDYMRREILGLREYLYAYLDDKAWLSHPDRGDVNKLQCLQTARRIGFDIPHTLVANRKRLLQEHRARHGAIIVKAINETYNFTLGEDGYATYTTLLDEERIERLDDALFPCLVQEALDKAYEIRVFYLNGACYSMAIFSQKDVQTSVDFRRYNLEDPNRTVPYRLPAELEDKVRRLMEAMALETGSLDIVKTKDGRWVFLEVNPVGQFEMVSLPCNYQLERKVAEFLIEKDRGYERKESKRA